MNTKIIVMQEQNEPDFHSSFPLVILDQQSVADEYVSKLEERKKKSIGNKKTITEHMSMWEEYHPRPTLPKQKNIKDKDIMRIFMEENTKWYQAYMAENNRFVEEKFSDEERADMNSMDENTSWDTYEVPYL